MAALLLFPPAVRGAEAHIVTVLRVIDGDTVALSDGRRVRLIGVDTPETRNEKKLRRQARALGWPAEALKRQGQHATDYLRGLVQGRPARLEFDDANARAGHRDRYGRVLAYLYIDPPAGRAAGKTVDSHRPGPVNVWLIEDGYGTATPRYSFSLKSAFLEAERQAKDAGRGIWRSAADLP